MQLKHPFWQPLKNKTKQKKKKAENFKRKTEHKKDTKKDIWKWFRSDKNEIWKNKESDNYDFDKEMTMFDFVLEGILDAKKQKSKELNVDYVFTQPF